MLTLRSKRWFCVSAGSGLLLLLLAQEKLCPWLVDQPDRDADVTKPQEGAPDGKEESRDQNTPRLPLLLPGTSLNAPRWPSSCDHATCRVVGHYRDGVVSCGLRDRVASNSTDDGAPAWLDLQSPRGPATYLITPDSRRVPTDPALHTCIQRIGPPLV